MTRRGKKHIREDQEERKTMTTPPRKSGISATHDIAGNAAQQNWPQTVTYFPGLQYCQIDVGCGSWSNSFRTDSAVPQLMATRIRTVCTVGRLLVAASALSTAKMR